MAGTRHGPKDWNDWDDGAAREQGNAGEDTADSAGAGYGDDR
jgi:hypothetical protein